MILNAFNLKAGVLTLTILSYGKADNRAAITEVRGANSSSVEGFMLKCVV